MDLNERELFMLNQHGEGSNFADLPRISVETHDHSSLTVPGQSFDFDFENKLIHYEEDDTEVFVPKEKDDDQTTKERRATFRQMMKKRREKKLLEKISSGDSSDYTYENHIALEGVKNEYPAIVVSAVVDEEGGEGGGGGGVRLPTSSSLDIPDDDPLAIEGQKKRKRRRSSRFSIASALTDISFGAQSSSSKVSSPSTLLDVDWEADDDLRDTLGDFLQNRKQSKRRHRRRGSTRSSDSAITEASSAADDLLDMYSQREDDKDRIFENIKLQKEIMASLRTQPWSMKKKLKTFQLTKNYIERYEGQLSRGHGYQEASAKYWKRVKREFVNLITQLIPWEMRIKLIESYFGSVVASYFTFLRWLFWDNIIMFVLSISFIVVPDIIFGAPYGSTPERSVPEGEIQRALNFETIMDFGGYLQHSILFYGYYQNDTIIGGIYRLPLAYFLVGLAHYGVSFLIILRKMTANSRLSKLTSKDEQYTFSWRIFASWDFMIGNPETAKNKVAEITIVLRESIEEEREKSKKSITKTVIFLRVLASSMVLIVLVSSTYAILLVVERSQATERKIERGEDVGWWDQNEVSFVMSLITALFPNIFDIIGLMEKYHPRTNLRLQLGRILVLYLLNLYTLMFALYWKITDKQNVAAAWLANCTLPYTGTTVMPDMVTDISGTLVTSQANCTGQSYNKIVCWETMLGREISKLVFFDLIMTVATIVVIDFVRGLGVRYLSRYWFWDLEQKFPEYGEFKIAENLLHAIYNQATIWLGVFFSPLLPGLNIVKLTIMLYVRSWAVLVCNIPHERVFKASRSNNFYFALLLLMLFLVTLPIAFLLVRLQPSTDCGPFKGLGYSFHVLTNTIQEEFPVIVNDILSYVASPGIIMPMLLLLIMAIYYLISVNGSLKESNDDLRNQILRERTEEREKVSKMAEAARAGTTGGGGGVVPETGKEKPQAPNAETEQMVNVLEETEKSGDEIEGMEDMPVSKTRILRVPGMSMDQANFLKTKFPGVKIMSREEAIKQNIIPPPPPPPPEPESDQEEPEIRIEMGPESEEDSPFEPEIRVEEEPQAESGQPEVVQSPDESSQIPTIQLEPMLPPPPSVPSDTPLTSQIAKNRAVRTRTSGTGSKPPIAVVQGKPSKRFLDDDKKDPTIENAAMY